MINFWSLEQRKPPDAQTVAKAARKVAKIPDDGDAGKVLCPFPFYASPLPVISGSDWTKSTLKQVKIKSLKGSTARVSRANLLWHVKNPGKSKFQGQWNSHMQVLKTKGGDKVIIDGHHRASALKLLKIKKDTVWMLKEGDL